MSEHVMRSTYVALYDRLCSEVEGSPLSAVLPGLLRLARAARSSATERWTRLELEGYTGDNPAMGEDVTVPEYRTVPGRYYDDYGRPLAVQDPELRFINEDRLRFGVPQLEKLAARNDEIRLQGTSAIDTVRNFLEVDVTSFGFSPTSVEGVLASIRTRTIAELENLEAVVEPLRKQMPPATSKSDRSWIRDHVWGLVATLLGGSWSRSFRPFSVGYNGVDSEGGSNCA